MEINSFLVVDGMVQVKFRIFENFRIFITFTSRNLGLVGEGQDGHRMELFAVIPRPSLSIQNIQIIKNSSLIKILKNFLRPERYESKNISKIFGHKVDGFESNWTVICIGPRW